MWSPIPLPKGQHVEKTNIFQCATHHSLDILRDLLPSLAIISQLNQLQPDTTQLSRLIGHDYC